MPELPDAVFTEIDRLSAEGNQLADNGNREKALERFQSAWNLLPEPRESWSAGLWLLASIGDMQFQLGQFADGRQTFMTAMKFFDEAAGNPFLRLRLGQCLYETGNQQEAANWLAGAYLLEGMKLFEGEDRKYIQFIKPQLDPPPGGWPKGW